MSTVKVILLILMASFFIDAISRDVVSPLIVIYDASGSMWGQIDGKSKMEIAREVLSNTVGKLPEGQKIGLVVYGHRDKGDCRDVEFLVDYQTGDKATFITSVSTIKPLGMTPLAYSATVVFDHLRETKSKATIILVTDGIESCDGNLCEVVQAAKADGIDFKMHIVGFGLKDEDTTELTCASDAGDGLYYDATNASSLSSVLQRATSQTVDMGIGNFSVYTNKNGLPVDAWVKAYDIKANHEPISVRTYGDTAYVFLRPSEYRLEVKPLEGSDVSAVFVEGVIVGEDQTVHRTIPFDAGKVGLTTTNNGSNWDCIVKVIDSSGKVVASTRSYQAPKQIEVDPGIYHVSIQALAIEGLETLAQYDSIVVRPNETTELSHNFDTGILEIDAQFGGKSIDSVVTIVESNSGKSVAGGRTYDRGHTFTLSVGKYRVKISPLGEHRNKEGKSIELEITMGDTLKQIIHF